MQEKKPAPKSQSTSTAVPLTDIFYRTLHYWPWVLLSLFISMSAGIIYLLRTPKVYTESASLLVKDDSKGKSSAAGSIEDFGDFGLFQSSTNIQNEMTTLKSPDLMEEVVKRLNLEMNYFAPGRFHKVVAYGTTLPVTVSLPAVPDNAYASLSLAVSPDGKVTVSDLKSGGRAADREYTGRLGDTIPTILGPLVVAPTKYYSKGEKVQLEVFKSSVGGATGGYEARLGVNMDNDKGTVINLFFTDQNIERADDVLNTVIAIYNENWIRDKNQIAVSTSNFINDRLGVIESELGNVDSDISSYKSANLVPDVSAAAASYLTESQTLSQEILALNNQLQMCRYIKSYLRSDGSHDKALPTNVGIDNLDIQSQIVDYNNKLLERNNLVAKSSDKNPIVQSMDKDLSELRGAIIASVDNSIVTLQTQMRGLQGARGSATSKLASNPTQAKYLLSVERQQKVKESLYLFLLQKREDNELSQAFTAYNTRVIKKPGGNGVPTAPNSRNVLLICFLIGIAVPFGTVYVKESSNTRVRGRKDVENLQSPMLGEIPEYGSGKKDADKDTKRELVVKGGKRDIINEAFRVLRTNTEFSKINKEGCDVIAVTSFNPGCGKSFISMNLAATLALKDRRTLVIDGDMRHGSSSAFIGSPKHGLSDYLSANLSDLDSCIVNVEGYKDLFVLPIGSTPPNPTELLESPRFKAMIEALRRDFDYIIIDCPPVEVVADAQIIDQFADRTIFVIRAGLLERSMLPQLDKLYEEKKYVHMAFILNGTRNDKGRYGYSHSYKYGYGYGYGYGYNYESKPKK